MLSLSRYRPLAVLALMQIAPTDQPEDEPWRTWLGASAGTLEHVQLYNCSAKRTSKRTQFVSGGVEAERFVAPRGRIHASGSYQQTDTALSTGIAVRGLIAFDGNTVGFGGGLAFNPGQTNHRDHDRQDTPVRVSRHGSTAPSLYARVGSKTAVQLRADLYPVGVASSHEVTRVALAYNQFDSARPSGFLGIGSVAPNQGAESRQAIIGELFIPVTPGIAIGGHGFFAPGPAYDVHGLSAQVRLVPSGRR